MANMSSIGLDSTGEVHLIEHDMILPLRYT